MGNDELSEGEKELLKIANDFYKFLRDKPKIRYNLHDTIREINEGFLVIKREL